jgi:hypothetical protein
MIPKLFYFVMNVGMVLTFEHTNLIFVLDYYFNDNYSS